jgi:hypothetical protein
MVNPSAGYGCGDAGVPNFCDNGVRQKPTCVPLIDEILKRMPNDDGTCAPPATATANGRTWFLDSDPMDPDRMAKPPRTAHMCQLKGAVSWVADMDIDCDGRTTAHCPGTGANRDPSYQNDTAVHTSGGAPLASELDKYVVIPMNNAGPFSPGAVVAVIYGSKIAYAVFGDTGPSDIIGEGSYALASALGIPPSPANGGVLGNTVTYLAFTGAGAVPADIENATAVAALGEKLVQQFLVDNP